MTKTQLDERVKNGCGIKGCNCTTGPMFVHCFLCLERHGYDRIEVSYLDGQLTVRCRCGAMLGEFKLAEN